MAIVVGGGGLKPFAAIPLFRFLETVQAEIDLLAGCSGGSIMSALYASSYTPEDIVERILPAVGKSVFRPNLRAWLAYGNMPFGRMDRTSALFPILLAVRRNPDIIIVLDFLEKIQGNPQGHMESMMHLSKLYAKTIIGRLRAGAITDENIIIDYQIDAK